MRCSKCGFENKDKAKFCSKCGNSLIVSEPPAVQNGSNNSKYIIIALLAIIVILVATIGFFVVNNGADTLQSTDASQGGNSPEAPSDDVADEDSDDSEDVRTTSVASTESSSSSKTDSRDWVSIGSYSGSGSGSQTISVPEGKIMVKLSAYPIKNYATNHLYVTGSNGQSGGVDWGSKSAVETRSDSFTYDSDSEEIFTIDYYETVSWEVEFFRYQ